MPDNLQMKLMFNIAALRVFGAQKFPSGRDIIEKRADLDLRSRGFTAVADNFDLATVDDNFSSSDDARFTRCQTEARYAGDAGQCFAAESECRHRLKISSRANLAGGVSLQGKQCVVAVHAAAVIDYANERNSAATNNDVDLASASIETVFD